MKNRPGLSWGPDLPVNAMRTSRGWMLVDWSSSKPRVIAIVSKRASVLARFYVYDLGSAANYGNDALDPETRAAIDATP